MRDLTRIGAVLAGIAGLMIAAVRVQAMRERTYPDPPVADVSLYVTSEGALRHLTLAYNALAADVYWIRAIQYYGGIKRSLAAELPMLAPPPALAANSPDAYPLLYPLLDLTTSLDPSFNIAYRFGAVFLAEPYPNGPGRPDLAIALLDKGIRQRSDKWEYMQDIGFVHYWYRHDYRVAATWFRKASELPSAPWWLRSLAATTLAQGGDRRSSRQMWEAIRASAEIEWLRTDAERRLAQLRALDDIDRLQAQVEAYRVGEGHVPIGWGDLFGGRVPVDPAGSPYELSDGRVRVSQASPLSPLPEEPQRIPVRPSP